MGKNKGGGGGGGGSGGGGGGNISTEIQADEGFQRFRLTKAFNYVLSCLEFQGTISLSVPPTLQLAATLSPYAMISS
ncbi:uncharacterized protein isoform X1 [Musca autumnalis]|uniref:uncharacterized protein isoform X1 n=1 Tax=Musca autumnalis TaxID=221902 RepID=UPI003CF6F74D